MYVYTHLPILQLALTNSPFLDVCLLWSACLCLYSLLEQSVFFHNSFLARLSTFSGASSAKEGPIHLPIWRDHQIVIKILFKHFCKYSKYLCLPSRELTYPTKREVRKNIDSKGAGDCRGYVIVPRRVLVKSDTPPPLFHHGRATMLHPRYLFPKTQPIPRNHRGAALEPKYCATRRISWKNFQHLEMLVKNRWMAAFLGMETKLFETQHIFLKIMKFHHHSELPGIFLGSLTWGKFKNYQKLLVNGPFQDSWKKMRGEQTNPSILIQTYTNPTFLGVADKPESHHLEKPSSKSPLAY